MAISSPLWIAHAGRNHSNSAGVIHMKSALVARSIHLIVGAALTALSTGVPRIAHADDQFQASSTGSLAEVIVTGTKRQEKLINLPITESVFDEAAIAKSGVARPQDFLAMVPNVTFIQSNQEGESFVNIRGQASVRLAQPDVAYVVDGVQLADPNEFNGEMFDLAQIEVLKGPQSALYGRNATAGAIIIRTKGPTNQFEGFAKVGVGNWNSTLAQAAFGGPIVPDKLLFRVAASSTSSDGAFTNIVSGEKSMRSDEKVGRATIKYLPTDALTMTLGVGGSHFTGGAISWNAQVAGTVVGGVPVPKIDANQTNIPFVSDVPGEDIQDKDNAYLKIDYKLGFGTFTSNTSMSHITDVYQAKNFPYAAYNDPRNDFGIFATIFGSRTQKIRIDNKAYSEELRLTSNSDQRFRWMTGVYLLDSTRRMVTINGLDTTGVILPNWGINAVDSVNPTDNIDDNRFTTKNAAPFANFEYNITGRWVLGAAARYDIERETVDTMTPDVPNPLFGSSPGAQGPTYNLCVLYTGLSPDQCHRSQTFKQFEPKVTLTYEIPNRGSAFISYGQGFKSGGYNPIGTRAALLRAPGVDPSRIFVQDGYGKETTNAYEVGFKSQWLDHRLNVNASLFWTEVKDAQQFEFFPSAGIQAISQIDKERIKGAELEVNAVLAPGLNVFVGYGYNDAKIVALRADPAYVGNRVPYSANYNIDSGIQYSKPLYRSVSLVTRLDYSRTGTVWWDSSNLPGTERMPVDLVDARLGLASDKWTVTLWSKNLFDERYNAEDIPLLSIVNAVYKAPPRSFGIEGSVNF